jgi:hypothetical protein
MDYRYQETVDWGIIKREWIHEDSRWLVVIELHEEDRYTVKIVHKPSGQDYYSYLSANGKLTFGSLADAEAFAAGQQQRMAALISNKDCGIPGGPGEGCAKRDDGKDKQN